MAKTILVVEDEQDIANIICFNLKRNGFETARPVCGWRSKLHPTSSCSM